MSRALSALFIAFAMLIAPFGSARAAMPAMEHQGVSASHCEDGKAPAHSAPTLKDCCVAACSAPSDLPASIELAELAASEPPFAWVPDLRTGIVTELPTPPPRSA